MPDLQHLEWFTSIIDLRLYYAYFAFPVSTPAQALALAELLEGRGLAKKAAALELLTGLGAKLSRASDLPSPSAPRDPIPTMVPALDRLLCGGLPRGGFVELSGRRSCGRFSIGIAALASATSRGEAAALVDLGGHLDPQAAEAAGVELDAAALGAPGKVEGRRRERRDAARGRIPARRPGPRTRARARTVRARRRVGASRARGPLAQRGAPAARAVPRQRRRGGHRPRRRRRARALEGDGARAAASLRRRRRGSCCRKTRARGRGWGR